MRDGTRCPNTASFPKGRGIVCKMPGHVEEYFSEALRLSGFTDTNTFITDSVRLVTVLRDHHRQMHGAKAAGLCTI